MTRQYSGILLLNIAGLALFFSWYLPTNHGFWFPLDAAVFHFFNQGIAENRTYVRLLTITNSRSFDACSLLAMGSLMLSVWFRENSAGRRRVIIIGLVMLLSAVVVNQLAQNIMPVKRSSPSLFFPDAYRVSNMLSAATKDASADSFPGDHGMMLLIFCAFMWRYFSHKIFLISLSIFVVFSLPRVMIGAHWLTDIIVGSLTAILIGMPWILMTPLSDAIITLFDRFLPLSATKIKQ